MSSRLVTSPPSDVDAYVTELTDTVVRRLDEVAPLRSKRVNSRRSPADLFLSADAVQAKRHRRKCERRWKRTSRDTDRKLYRDACRSTANLINQSRASYLAERLRNAPDCRSKWRALHGVLHSVNRADGPASPTFPSIFSKFQSFKLQSPSTKLTSVLSSPPGPPSLDPLFFDRPHTGSSFSTFLPVTAAEVRPLLTPARIKPSSVDPFPSSLLYSCPRFFSVIIANLANLSFTSGSFPSSFKSAIITPLLKKPGLDPSDPASYRPISNLNSISKILERLALTRLQPHITASSSFDSLQSAYRKGHSTETALLSTLTNIYKHIDSGSSSIAVSLDLSSAFDTVSHSILLSRLESSFGVSGHALSWLSSYLTGRSQTVSLNGISSTSCSITSGVPQGSVLGPLLFSTFVSPVSSLLSSCNLEHQQYADDLLVYCSLTFSNFRAIVSHMESSLSSLCYWFALNGLSVNPSKSEAILFGTRERLSKLHSAGLNEIRIFDSKLPFSSQITVLGVCLDSLLSFDAHCNTVVRSSLFHYRALRHVCHLLSASDLCLASTTLVQSKLDYCNALLYSTSKRNLARIQRLQNSLARLTLRSNLGRSSSECLATLHWLPIAQRIDFKIATLTHSILSTGCPSYLSSNLNRYIPTRQLRSADKLLLTVPRTHLAGTARSFGFSGPSVWNSLPLELRQITSNDLFRSRLKTHFFSSNVP